MEKMRTFAFFGEKKNPCSITSVCQSSFAHVVKIFKNNITCTVGDTFKCAAPEMIERNSVHLANKKKSPKCVF